eukprot:gene20258-27012_t
MNFFNQMMGKSSTSEADEVSLLADWKSYSTNTPDVESGAGPSTSDTLFKHVDSARNITTDLFRTSYTAVSEGANSAVAGLPTAETFSVPTSTQLIYFFCFLAGGGVFLMLAFTIFLPIIILSPSKFAMSFTLGCLLIMTAFTMLKGWKQQMKHMMTRERLPFSAGYIGSIIATLYAALIMHSYLLSLLCSGLQVVALLYYMMSYFPGGTQGVKFMLGLFSNAVTRGLTSCFGK